MTQKNVFFSISHQAIITDLPLTYDLYINSSALEHKEKFVRIFKIGEILNIEEVVKAYKKYLRFYVDENQRAIFLQSLLSASKDKDKEKVNFIKNSAIEYLDHLFEQDKLEQEEFAPTFAAAMKGCRESVEGMITVLQDYKISDLQKLIGELSFHDFYTYDHSINVSMYALLIMKRWRPKAKHEDIMALGMGALLHDLGKIKISNAIINNPDKITDEEFAEIQKHPGYGQELFCQHMESNDLDVTAIERVIHEHHENVNGTGYPQKISGIDIHPFAKITALADFFDAITTKRSYHEVLSPEGALEVIRKSVGKKIDPLFFQVLEDLIKDGTFASIGVHKELTLPEDFDPCQPHRQLPFEKVSEQEEHGHVAQKGNIQTSFGKVKLGK